MVFKIIYLYYIINNKFHLRKFNLQNKVNFQYILSILYRYITIY